MVFQMELFGEMGEGTLSDEVRPPHRKGSFLGLRKFLKQKVTHCEVENCVAEKFQDFI
jgi:hypothetical protein